jgi:hypothetical protein
VRLVRPAFVLPTPRATTQPVPLTRTRTRAPTASVRGEPGGMPWHAGVDGQPVRRPSARLEPSPAECARERSGCHPAGPWTYVYKERLSYPLEP